MEHSLNCNSRRMPMYQVEEPLETVHLYVVREEQPRPFFLLPFVVALLCVGVMVGVTVSSGMHPSYLHQTLTLPAHLFTREYHTTEPIMPTGTKTSPATYATGLLTFYNGSIVVQQLPAGTVIVGTDGTQAMTEALVAVPAVKPRLYGVAAVSAHALAPRSR